MSLVGEGIFFRRIEGFLKELEFRRESGGRDGLVSGLMTFAVPHLLFKDDGFVLDAVTWASLSRSRDEKYCSRDNSQRRPEHIDEDQDDLKLDLNAN